jgi:hypothetical protein
MEIGFYHSSIGYWQAIEEPSAQILSSYPVGTRRIPVKPGAGYEYNGVDWVPPPQSWLDDRAAENIRGLRDIKLRRDVDSVATNTLRWNSLSTEKQAEWSTYRQALLDVTKQSGFPHQVVWPPKP